MLHDLGWLKQVKLEDSIGTVINPATVEKLDELKVALTAIYNAVDDLELTTESIKIESEHINLNTDDLEAEIQSVRDQLDVVLSTRASELTLSNVKTVLDNIKTVLDTLGGAIDVNLSTLATESTLTAVKDAVDTLETKLQTIIDSLDVELSTRASEATVTEIKETIGQESGVTVLSRLQDLRSQLDVALSTRASEATVASILGQVDITLSALLAGIKGSGNKDLTTLEADVEAILLKFDTDLSTLASEATLIEVRDYLDTVETKLQSLIDKNQAQETGGNLDSIKSNTDKLDVNLSTRASESTVSSVNTKFGEVSATPTVNTLLGRLKDLWDKLVELFNNGVARVKLWDGTNQAGISPLGDLYTSMVQNVKESTNNNSTDNLLAGGWFTGVGETTLGIVGIQVNFKCNETCTLYIDQSIDNINWDITDTWIVLGGVGHSRTFQATASYFRIRVHNDGALTTTYLRLLVALCPIVECLPRALSFDGRLKVEATTVSSELSLPIQVKYDKAFTAINANEWQELAGYIVPAGYSLTITSFRCHSETAGEDSRVFVEKNGGTYDRPTSTFTPGDTFAVPQFGSGLYLKVTTAISASGGITDPVVITYINEKGDTGRTCTIALPKSSLVGTSIEGVLQGDDLGVREITNISSTEIYAGAFKVDIYYNLFNLLMTSANTMYQATAIGGNAVRVKAGNEIVIGVLAGTKTSYIRHLSLFGTLNPV